MSNKWKDQYEKGWTDLDQMNRDADEAYEEERRQEAEYDRLHRTGKVATARSVTSPKEKVFVDPGYQAAYDRQNHRD